MDGTIRVSLTRVRSCGVSILHCNGESQGYGCVCVFLIIESLGLACELPKYYEYKPTVLADPGASGIS